MHPKKRRRVSPESRRDGEKDQGPVIKVVWVNDGLSRALRLFKVRILVYAALRREWNTTLIASLEKILLASTTQIKIGLVSIHRSSVFPGIKSVMAQGKNHTKNECSYGRYEIFPILMTRRLDLGKSIAVMGLLTSKRSASALLLLLVQQGCGFQTPLDDHGLFPSLLEW